MKKEQDTYKKDLEVVSTNDVDTKLVSSCLGLNEECTAKWMAELLGVDIRTVTRHANKLYPNKLKNGVATTYNVLEATEILESIKSANKNQYTFVGVTKVNKDVSTRLSAVLKFKKANDAMKEALSEMFEYERLEAEQLRIRLSEAEKWYSVKRVLIETGTEYSYKPLLTYSKEHDIEVKKVFDQNYREVNAYHVDVWYHVYGLEL
jgi:hypothetical protein